MILSNFYWILPERLAGAGQPGLFDSMETDIARLHKVGVRFLVSLIEEPLDPPTETFGLRSLHFPIPDMGFPSAREAHPICAQILAAMDAGEPTLLHCKAGQGRTGTMLACCLVNLGRSAEEAILEIRRIYPGYIQTSAQETFVGHYAAYLAAGTKDHTHRPADLPSLKLPGVGAKEQSTTAAALPGLKLRLPKP